MGLTVVGMWHTAAASLSLLAGVLLCVTAGMPVAAQRMLVSADPDAARIVTSDIPNFWQVFDRAPLSDVAALASAFERGYLDAGSAGLADFTRFRIETPRALAEAVAARRLFYQSIRETTLAVHQDPRVRDSIRDVYRRLKALYPDAAFPDVYLLIGRLSTGGTVTSAGLLIAVEMNARDSRTPLGELSPWERATIGQLANLPYVVAHEVVHVQQRLRRNEAQTLLTNALIEGAADFVAELLTGDNGNRAQRAYGDAHERDLWSEFSREMSGRDSSRWLGQGDRSVGRPADLGYYVGYKICEAFYQRATVKTGAVRTIIEMADAEAFLRESRYAGGWR
jgi:hypothetical protein